MTQLNLHATVGRWVAEHPRTSRVFEAHKIDYCCGGSKSLEQACREHGFDPDDVLARLHEAVDAGDQDTRRDWSHATCTELCDQIEQSHHAYLRRELPRLTDLIAKVVAAHGERHPELAALQHIFGEFRSELELHMRKEEQILFPAIRWLERSEMAPAFAFGTIANPIRMMEHEHDNAGDALAHFRALTREYHAPDDACKTYRAMLDGLRELEADMHQHVHKENNLLFPKAIRLESRITTERPQTGD